MNDDRAVFCFCEPSEGKKEVAGEFIMRKETGRKRDGSPSCLEEIFSSEEETTSSNSSEEESLCLRSDVKY